MQGKIVLKVGKHELKGSVVKLEKPLAVLKKSTNDSSSSMEVTAADLSTDSSSHVSYEVVGVVRSKYLFRDRPKVLLERS